MPSIILGCFLQSQTPQLRIVVHLQGLHSAFFWLTPSYTTVGYHHQVVSVVPHVNQECGGCRPELGLFVAELTSRWLNRAHSLLCSTHNAEPRDSKWKLIHWWALWRLEDSSIQLQRFCHKCSNGVFFCKSGIEEVTGIFSQHVLSQDN